MSPNGDGRFIRNDEFWGWRFLRLAFDNFPVMIRTLPQIMPMIAADHPNAEEFPKIS
ncbi:hypothetical protein [Brucella anthropi]|uniref:hypothetical protein n=1 Tax=Brucella anthropi TaxID=529 RepID=UPI003986EA7C